MSNVLYVDMAKLYFGDDIKINEKISIHSPTVGDIITYGEKDYYAMISALTSIPSDMKSGLWDMGIDYEEVSDLEFFFMMTRNLTPKETSIILGDLDLSKLKMYQNIENDTLVLGYSEEDILLNEFTYTKLVYAIRTIHGIKSKVEKAANKTTKRILIQLDREKTEKAKKEEYKSSLIPLVSAMMRYPGFKYKSYELKKCTLYEFMDTVQGAQIYVNSTALLQGSYSGMIDVSKVNKKEFNWLRDANE